MNFAIRKYSSTYKVCKNLFEHSKLASAILLTNFIRTADSNLCTKKKYIRQAKQG